MSKKIFMIGDIHLGLGYPTNVDKWLKTHKQYFENFLIPYLNNTVEDGDIIITLGDFFDNRNYIPINILNYGISIIEQISNIAPTHMIIGNHDLWTKSASGVNSVNMMRYIPNVKVYDTTTVINYNGKKLLMMTYIDNRNGQIKEIDNNKNCDYLFCHSDLNGARMHLSNVLQNNPDKIGIDNFVAFKHVYSGHIHREQKTKNFTFVGSIFQMDRNDTDNQKGIYILDTDTGKDVFIKNNISPIFEKIIIKDDNDLDKLSTMTTSNNYIDVSISNNMLINDKKYRHKLEKILEKGSFAKIDYIDDITSSDNDNNIDFIETIDKPLDYNKYIIDYINAQNYDNDIFKEKIINIAKEIIKNLK